MFHVNENLRVWREQKNNCVVLESSVNLTTKISILLTPVEWEQIVKEIGEARPLTSVYAAAMQAHEKFVQLDIAGQFEIGLKVGLITKEEGSDLDAVALHNAALEMIREAKNLHQIDVFMNQVEKYWKEQH